MVCQLITPTNASLANGVPHCIPLPLHLHFPLTLLPFFLCTCPPTQSGYPLLSAPKSASFLVFTLHLSIFPVYHYVLLVQHLRLLPLFLFNMQLRLKWPSQPSLRRLPRRVYATMRSTNQPSCTLRDPPSQYPFFERGWRFTSFVQ